MPRYKYVSDEERTYYPPGAPAIKPEPGSTYSMRQDPSDGRWVLVNEKKNPADPAPAGDTNKE